MREFATKFESTFNKGLRPTNRLGLNQDFLFESKNAKVAEVKVETFDGTSTQLGIICGKSFPISTLVIKS